MLEHLTCKLILHCLLLTLNTFCHRFCWILNSFITSLSEIIILPRWQVAQTLKRQYDRSDRYRDIRDTSCHNFCLWFKITWGVLEITLSSLYFSFSCCYGCSSPLLINTTNEVTPHPRAGPDLRRSPGRAPGNIQGGGKFNRYYWWSRNLGLTVRWRASMAIKVAPV